MVIVGSFQVILMHPRELKIDKPKAEFINPEYNYI